MEDTKKKQEPYLSTGKKILLNSICLCLSMGFIILTAELGIRVLDRYQRSQILDYNDTWRKNGMGPGGYLKENFIGKVADGYGGEVEWINNSNGFRSRKEFSRNKKTGVLRILSLGDSFTAGYRVGQDKTYSALIRDWLGSKKIPNEVLISCIESPHRGLEYLKKEGINWNPDAVILGVTLGNDIAQDYISLHPLQILPNELAKHELPESTLCKRSQFSNALVYLMQHSRILARISPESRASVSLYGPTLKPKIFDPCHGLALYIRNSPEIIKEAYKRHLSVIDSYATLCKKNNIVFAVLLFPQRFQIQPNDWSATARHYGLRKDAFDLSLPNNIIRRFCDKKEISLVDPTESMQKIHAKYQIEMYLPNGDMHWNQAGHYWWFKSAVHNFDKMLSPLMEKIRSTNQQLKSLSQEGSKG